MAAVGAVVVVAAQADRAQDGVDGLLPVVGELCLVALTTVHSGTAMPGVEIQKPFQQAPPDLEHGRADRQLDSGQPFARGIAQLARRQLAEALYLGGEVRLELREEPLFLDSASGGVPASAETGLASQIASLTSTICSSTALNCL